MTSIEARNTDLFLRDNFVGVGQYGMPILYRQHINLENLEYISFDHVLASPKGLSNQTVHFYQDDYKFEKVWTNPENMFPAFKIMPMFFLQILASTVTCLWQCKYTICSVGVGAVHIGSNKALQLYRPLLGLTSEAMIFVSMVLSAVALLPFLLSVLNGTKLDIWRASLNFAPA